MQTVYALGECVQTDYLHEVKRPETIFGPNHQSYNPGGGGTGHFHQVQEFNDRIQEQVGRTMRTQRPEDPGGISDQCRRHPSLVKFGQKHGLLYGGARVEILYSLCQMGKGKGSHGGQG